jgi:hypothetical protein
MVPIKDINWYTAFSFEVLHHSYWCITMALTTKAIKRITLIYLPNTIKIPPAVPTLYTEK